MLKCFDFKNILFDIYFPMELVLSLLCACLQYPLFIFVWIFILLILILRMCSKLLNLYYKTILTIFHCVGQTKYLYMPLQRCAEQTKYIQMSLHSVEQTVYPYMSATQPFSKLKKFQFIVTKRKRKSLMSHSDLFFKNHNYVLQRFSFQLIISYVNSYLSSFQAVCLKKHKNINQSLFYFLIFKKC